jgi:hypothetical protein
VPRGARVERDAADSAPSASNDTPPVVGASADNNTDTHAGNSADSTADGALDTGEGTPSGDAVSETSGAVPAPAGVYEGTYVVPIDPARSEQLGL